MAEGGAGSVASGGAAGGGGSGDPFLEHCALAQVESGSVCLENVIAKAGDVIDIEIWLMLPASCDWSTQFNVTFTYDDSNLTFEPDPVEDFYDGPYQCVLTPDQPPGSFALLKLSASAQGGCPEQFTPGLHTILRATVAADAPAGDYVLSIASETVGDNLTQSPDCRSQADQMHWDGIVRIVD